MPVSDRWCGSVSRILREWYPELIHVGDIFDAFNIINKESALVTQDVRPSRAPIDYIRGLRACRPEKRRWIEGKHGDGISLRSKSGTFSKPLCFYGRGREFRRRPVSGIPVDYFDGVLRVENRLTRAQ